MSKEQGDRVGVLLGFDNGSVRFFKNGAQHDPGYGAGSTTGLVIAALERLLKTPACGYCQMRSSRNRPSPGASLSQPDGELGVVSQ
jgi:hypothetical protein